MKGRGRSGDVIVFESQGKDVSATHFMKLTSKEAGLNRSHFSDIPASTG